MRGMGILITYKYTRARRRCIRSQQALTRGKITVVAIVELPSTASFIPSTHSSYHTSSPVQCYLPNTSHPGVASTQVHCFELSIYRAVRCSVFQWLLRHSALNGAVPISVLTSLILIVHQVTGFSTVIVTLALAFLTPLPFLLRIRRHCLPTITLRGRLSPIGRRSPWIPPITPQSSLISDLLHLSPLPT